MHRAKDVLRAGCDILAPVLAPHGFRFKLRDSGNSSGGDFAWGEFVRGTRRLEVHFRYSLGLVAYRIGDAQATHDAYMRTVVGAPGAYPGFSDEPLEAFRHLRQDLEGFGGPFLNGNDAELHTILQRACEEEKRKPKGLLGVLQ